MSEPITSSAPSPTAYSHGPVPGPPAAAPAARNKLALIALLLGVAAIVVSVLGQWVPLAILSAGGHGAMQVYGAIMAVISLLALLLALAAVICGVIAAQRPMGKVAAGVGVGIGIAEIVAVLAGFVYGGLASLL